MTKNREAFLTMIGVSEGTVTSKLTRDRGYDVIVTDNDPLTPEIFTDYSRHPFEDGRPPKLINPKTGLRSTAAGRYQILLRFWVYYRKLLRLPDFGPASQDAYCIQQFRERGALAFIDAGRFDDAIARLSGIWASMPGRAYEGQRQNKIEALRVAYVNAGGTLA